MVNDALPVKAAYFEDAILTKCIDPDRFLLRFTRRSDMEPADDVIRQVEWTPHVQDVERGAFYGYDNLNQAAGKFIPTMSYRYAATRD